MRPSDITSTSRPERGAADAALRGALAAVVGGLALRAAWEAGQRALPGDQRLPSPTDRTVDVLAARRGVTLSPAQTRAASLGVYTGAMVTWGALLGAARTRLPMSPLAQGLLLGGILYAANFPKATGVLPRLGVLAPPGDQTRAQAAVPVAAHLVGGLATGAVLAALD
jgi:hypothetical protein